MPLRFPHIARVLTVLVLSATGGAAPVPGDPKHLAKNSGKLPGTSVWAAMRQGGAKAPFRPILDPTQGVLPKVDELMDNNVNALEEALEALAKIGDPNATVAFFGAYGNGFPPGMETALENKIFADFVRASQPLPPGVPMSPRYAAWLETARANVASAVGGPPPFQPGAQATSTFESLVAPLLADEGTAKPWKSAEDALIKLRAFRSPPGTLWYDPLKALTPKEERALRAWLVENYGTGNGTRKEAMLGLLAVLDRAASNNEMNGPGPFRPNAAHALASKQLEQRIQREQASRLAAGKAVSHEVDEFLATQTAQNPLAPSLALPLYLSPLGWLPFVSATLGKNSNLDTLLWELVRNPTDGKLLELFQRLEKETDEKAFHKRLAGLLGKGFENVADLAHTLGDTTKRSALLRARDDLRRKLLTAKADAPSTRILKAALDSLEREMKFLQDGGSDGPTGIPFVKREPVVFDKNKVYTVANAGDVLHFLDEMNRQKKTTGSEFPTFRLAERRTPADVAELLSLAADLDHAIAGNGHLVKNKQASAVFWSSEKERLRDVRQHLNRILSYYDTGSATAAVFDEPPANATPTAVKAAMVQQRKQAQHMLAATQKRPLVAETFDTEEFRELATWAFGKKSFGEYFGWSKTNSPTEVQREQIEHLVLKAYGLASRKLLKTFFNEQDAGTDAFLLAMEPQGVALLDAARLFAKDTGWERDQGLLRRQLALLAAEDAKAENRPIDPKDAELLAASRWDTPNFAQRPIESDKWRSYVSRTYRNDGSRSDETRLLLMMQLDERIVRERKDLLVGRKAIPITRGETATRFPQEADLDARRKAEKAYRTLPDEKRRLVDAIVQALPLNDYVGPEVRLALAQAPDSVLHTGLRVAGRSPADPLATFILKPNDVTAHGLIVAAKIPENERLDLLAGKVGRPDEAPLTVLNRDIAVAFQPNPLAQVAVAATGLSYSADELAKMTPMRREQVRIGVLARLKTLGTGTDGGFSLKHLLADQQLAEVLALFNLVRVIDGWRTTPEGLELALSADHTYPASLRDIILSEGRVEDALRKASPRDNDVRWFLEELYSRDIGVEAQRANADFTFQLLLLRHPRLPVALRAKLLRGNFEPLEEGGSRDRLVRLAQLWNDSPEAFERVAQLFDPYRDEQPAHLGKPPNELYTAAMYEDLEGDEYATNVAFSYRYATEGKDQPAAVAANGRRLDRIIARLQNDKTLDNGTLMQLFEGKGFAEQYMDGENPSDRWLTDHQEFANPATRNAFLRRPASEADRKRLLEYLYRDKREIAQRRAWADREMLRAHLLKMDVSKDKWTFGKAYRDWVIETYPDGDDPDRKRLLSSPLASDNSPIGKDVRAFVNTYLPSLPKPEDPEPAPDIDDEETGRHYRIQLAAQHQRQRTERLLDEERNGGKPDPTLEVDLRERLTRINDDIARHEKSSDPLVVVTGGRGAQKRPLDIAIANLQAERKLITDRLNSTRCGTDGTLATRPRRSIEVRSIFWAKCIEWSDLTMPNLTGESGADWPDNVPFALDAFGGTGESLCKGQPTRARTELRFRVPPEAEAKNGPAFFRALIASLEADPERLERAKKLATRMAYPATYAGMLNGKDHGMSFHPKAGLMSGILHASTERFVSKMEPFSGWGPEARELARGDALLLMAKTTLSSINARKPKAEHRYEPGDLANQDAEDQFVFLLTKLVGFEQAVPTAMSHPTNRDEGSTDSPGPAAIWRSETVSAATTRTTPLGAKGTLDDAFAAFSEAIVGGTKSKEEARKPLAALLKEQPNLGQELLFLTRHLPASSPVRDEAWRLIYPPEYQSFFDDPKFLTKMSMMPGELCRFLWGKSEGRPVGTTEHPQLAAEIDNFFRDNRPETQGGSYQAGRVPNAEKGLTSSTVGGDSLPDLIGNTIEGRVNAPTRDIAIARMRSKPDFQRFLTLGPNVTAAEWNLRVEQAENRIAYHEALIGKVQGQLRATPALYGKMPKDRAAREKWFQDVLHLSPAEAKIMADATEKRSLGDGLATLDAATRQTRLDFDDHLTAAAGVRLRPETHAPGCNPKFVPGTTPRQPKNLHVYKQFLAECGNSGSAAFGGNGSTDYRFESDQRDPKMGRRFSLTAKWQYPNLAPSGDYQPAGMPSNAQAALADLSEGERSGLDFLVGWSMSFVPGPKPGDRPRCEVLHDSDNKDGRGNHYVGTELTPENVLLPGDAKQPFWHVVHQHTTNERPVEKWDATALYRYVRRAYFDRGPKLEYFEEQKMRELLKVALGPSYTSQEVRDWWRSIWGNPEENQSGSYIEDRYWHRTATPAKWKAPGSHASPLTKEEIADLILNPSPAAIYRSIFTHTTLRTNYLFHLAHRVKAMAGEETVLDKIPGAKEAYGWKNLLEKLPSAPQSQIDEVRRFVFKTLTGNEPVPPAVEEVLLLFANLNEALGTTPDKTFDCRRIAETRFTKEMTLKRLAQGGYAPPGGEVFGPPPPKIALEPESKLDKDLAEVDSGDDLAKELVYARTVEALPGKPFGTVTRTPDFPEVLPLSPYKYGPRWNSELDIARKKLGHYPPVVTKIREALKANPALVAPEFAPGSGTAKRKWLIDNLKLTAREASLLMPFLGQVPVKDMPLRLEQALWKASDDLENHARRRFGGPPVAAVETPPTALDEMFLDPEITSLGEWVRTYAAARSLADVPGAPHGKITRDSRLWRFLPLDQKGADDEWDKQMAFALKRTGEYESAAALLLKNVAENPKWLEGLPENPKQRAPWLAQKLGVASWKLSPLRELLVTGQDVVQAAKIVQKQMGVITSELEAWRRIKTGQPPVASKVDPAPPKIPLATTEDAPPLVGPVAPETPLSKAEEPIHEAENGSELVDAVVLGRTLEAVPGQPHGTVRRPPPYDKFIGPKGGGANWTTRFATYRKRAEDYQALAGILRVHIAQGKKPPEDMKQFSDWAQRTLGLSVWRSRQLQQILSAGVPWEKIPDALDKAAAATVADLNAIPGIKQDTITAAQKQKDEDRYFARLVAPVPPATFDLPELWDVDIAGHFPEDVRAAKLVELSKLIKDTASHADPAQRRLKEGWEKAFPQLTPSARREVEVLTLGLARSHNVFRRDPPLDWRGRFQKLDATDRDALEHLEYLLCKRLPSEGGTIHSCAYFTQLLRDLNVVEIRAALKTFDPARAQYLGSRGYGIELEQKLVKRIVLGAKQSKHTPKWSGPVDLTFSDVKDLLASTRISLFEEMIETRAGIESARDPEGAASRLMAIQMALMGPDGNLPSDKLAADYGLFKLQWLKADDATRAQLALERPLLRHMVAQEEKLRGKAFRQLMDDFQAKNPNVVINQFELATYDPATNSVGAREPDSKSDFPTSFRKLADDDPLREFLTQSLAALDGAHDIHDTGFAGTDDAARDRRVKSNIGKLSLDARVGEHIAAKKHRELVCGKTDASKELLDFNERTWKQWKLKSQSTADGRAALGDRVRECMKPHIAGRRKEERQALMDQGEAYPRMTRARLKVGELEALQSRTQRIYQLWVVLNEEEATWNATITTLGPARTPEELQVREQRKSRHRITKEARLAEVEKNRLYLSSIQARLTQAIQALKDAYQKLEDTQLAVERKLKALDEKQAAATNVCLERNPVPENDEFRHWITLRIEEELGHPYSPTGRYKANPALYLAHRDATIKHFEARRSGEELAKALVLADVEDSGTRGFQSHPLFKTWLASLGDACDDAKALLIRNVEEAFRAERDKRRGRNDEIKGLADELKRWNIRIVAGNVDLTNARYFAGKPEELKALLDKLSRVFGKRSSAVAQTDISIADANGGFDYWSMLEDSIFQQWIQQGKPKVFPINPKTAARVSYVNGELKITFEALGPLQDKVKRIHDAFQTELAAHKGLYDAYRNYEDQFPFWKARFWLNREYVNMSGPDSIEEAKWLSHNSNLKKLIGELDDYGTITTGDAGGFASARDMGDSFGLTYDSTLKNDRAFLAGDMYTDGLARDREALWMAASFIPIPVPGLAGAGLAAAGCRLLLRTAMGFRAGLRFHAMMNTSQNLVYNISGEYLGQEHAWGSPVRQGQTESEMWKTAVMFAIQQGPAADLFASTGVLTGGFRVAAQSSKLGGAFAAPGSAAAWSARMGRAWEPAAGMFTASFVTDTVFEMAHHERTFNDAMGYAFEPALLMSALMMPIPFGKTRVGTWGPNPGIIGAGKFATFDMGMQAYNTYLGADKEEMQKNLDAEAEKLARGELNDEQKKEFTGKPLPKHLIEAKRTAAYWKIQRTTWATNAWMYGSSFKHGMADKKRLVIEAQLARLDKPLTAADRKALDLKPGERENDVLKLEDLVKMHGEAEAKANTGWRSALRIATFNHSDVREAQKAMNADRDAYVKQAGSDAIRQILGTISFAEFRFLMENADFRKQVAPLFNMTPERFEAVFKSYFTPERWLSLGGITSYQRRQYVMQQAFKDMTELAVAQISGELRKMMPTHRVTLPEGYADRQNPLLDEARELGIPEWHTFLDVRTLDITRETHQHAVLRQAHDAVGGETLKPLDIRRVLAFFQVFGAEAGNWERAKAKFKEALAADPTLFLPPPPPPPAPKAPASYGPATSSGANGPSWDSDLDSDWGVTRRKYGPQPRNAPKYPPPFRPGPSNPGGWRPSGPGGPGSPGFGGPGSYSP